LRYNRPMRVLLVKLSSMGDVLHNLPVVSDLARAYPDIEIEWVTEAAYAPLVMLHPGVRRAIPLQLRSLKKNWWSPAAWSAFLDSKNQLANQTYDMVLDTQGLLKSAFVARWANGSVAGFSRRSAREPFAARFYDQEIEVPRDLHAVKRNRQLAAGTFGYALKDTVDYGLRFRAYPADFVRPFSQEKYAVFLHATSRANKMWPESHWIALGKRLHEIGIGVVLPWGSTDERRVSERLAGGIPGAISPTAMSLLHAAALLAEASVVIGVDTGLAHLAVALARPSVGLYVTTSPALTGLYGSSLAVNLGGGSPSQPTVPGVDETWLAVGSLLGLA
ncbi:MAG: lipopolysaccharide heptosyltransferase I, partial [Betaproteobacteria bacterium]